MYFPRVSSLRRLGSSGLDPKSQSIKTLFGCLKLGISSTLETYFANVIRVFVTDTYLHYSKKWHDSISPWVTLMIWKLMWRALRSFVLYILFFNLDNLIWCFCIWVLRVIFGLFRLRLITWDLSCKLSTILRKLLLLKWIDLWLWHWIKIKKNPVL